MNYTQEKITRDFTINHALSTVKSLQEGCGRELKNSKKIKNNEIDLIKNMAYVVKIKMIQASLRVARAALTSCADLINNIDD